MLLHMPEHALECKAICDDAAPPPEPESEDQDKLNL